jgi:hypothetical protein
VIAAHVSSRDRRTEGDTAHPSGIDASGDARLIPIAED